MKRFCIPPENNAAFVHAMEDVLEVYHRPYDEEVPVVCLDETSKQLLAHTRHPLAPEPGIPQRVDDEYKRNGTANLFAAIEPLTGKCLVDVTERRTAKDTALFFQKISDELYPNARKIVLVMDNLNTHTMACFYEAFAPLEARRLTERFEVHHTPKHGSWLNVAESFLSTLSIQCLNQRIGSMDALKKQLADWKSARTGGKVNWQFATPDARIKLRRLYPKLE